MPSTTSRTCGPFICRTSSSRSRELPVQRLRRVADSVWKLFEKRVFDLCGDLGVKVWKKSSRVFWSFIVCQRCCKTALRAFQPVEIDLSWLIQLVQQIYLCFTWLWTIQILFVFMESLHSSAQGCHINTTTVTMPVYDLKAGWIIPACFGTLSGNLTIFFHIFPKQIIIRRSKKELIM